MEGVNAPRPHCKVWSVTIRKPPYAIKGTYGGVRGGESPLLDFASRQGADSLALEMLDKRKASHWMTSVRPLF
jgi:hypothetical protein